MSGSEVEKGELEKGGVPEMPFIEDLVGFLEGKNAETVFKQIQEDFYKYKYMEQNFSQKKVSLRNKIPEISNTLDMIDYLKRAREAEREQSVNFVLSDNLYTRAKLEKTDKVGIWLGAKVMVEYSLDEAEALMKKTVADARTSLSKTETDLTFLKDQITTCEVNLARIYNYMVNMKK